MDRYSRAAAKGFIVQESLIVSEHAQSPYPMNHFIGFLKVGGETGRREEVIDIYIGSR